MEETEREILIDENSKEMEINKHNLWKKYMNTLENRQ